MNHTRFASSLALCLALAAPGACTPKGSADTVPPAEAAPAPAPAPEPEPEPVAPIPEGFHSVTAGLTVKDVDAAVDFYTRAFAAEKVLAMPGEDGKTAHAQIKIGDSIVMIEVEHKESKSPETLGGPSGALFLYVDDVDAAFATAIKEGAKEHEKVADMFWGDRYGGVVDPFGHRWGLATHVEDLTPEQMGQRAEIYAKAKNPKKATKKWKKIAGTPATQKRPDGFFTVTPVLTSADAAAAIDFYTAAFGATEVERMPGKDGKIMHAEVRIGDSIVMLHDEYPKMGAKSPKTLGGATMGLMIYTEDVDAAFAKATASGAEVGHELADMFWGDRFGMVRDPSGHSWGLATHKEDLTPEQMQERMKQQQAEKAS